ncbi:MAG: TerC family protein [Phycisphaerae bacterium]|nr:TerC family protein [Phycisphaerae bacterium]MDW8261851.1 TerC family protein [Phycisphaerales bacterium]
MIWFWLGFLALIAGFLALDLGVFHRKAHVVSIREALIWSAVWISTSLLFSIFVYFAYANHWMGLGIGNPSSTIPEVREGLDGVTAWTKYITGYVVEWSLSVDNIFVIALIFTYFRIPRLYQHRVLFWGIMGAIVMRGIFIALGTAIIASFHWVIYVFGVFLIFTAVKMLTSSEDPDPSRSRVLRFVYRHFPVTDKLHGSRFVVYESEIPRQEAEAASHHPEFPSPAESVESEPEVEAAPTGHLKAGRRILTPLMVALIIVEVTDLIFAVDSIPAIFGITKDPFLVFTSNIFAILGLRSMYFALGGLLHKFHLLKTALAMILGLVGIKMLFGVWIEHQLGLTHNQFSVISLCVILSLLVFGVIGSLLFPRKPDHEGLMTATTAQKPE